MAGLMAGLTNSRPRGAPSQAVPAQQSAASSLPAGADVGSRSFSLELPSGHRVTVDCTDLPLLDKYQWYHVHGQNRVTPKSYVVGCVRGVYDNWVLMHRLILSAPTGVQVDHINGDGLDNRRANLRLCNNSQNQMNCRVVRSASGFKGVYCEHPNYRRPWAARLRRGPLNKFIGSFATAIEAAKAYDEAAIKYFGEFAATNESLGLLRAEDFGASETSKESPEPVLAGLSVAASGCSRASQMKTAGLGDHAGRLSSGRETSPDTRNSMVVVKPS